MSLGRFVYYSAVVGGWAAFAAWMLAEGLVLGGEDATSAATVIGVGALVGAAIGAGLNLVSGMTNAQWRRQLARLPPGLLGGGLGGAVGGLLGNLAFLVLPLSVSRAVGWMIMGLAIGAAEGIYEKSSRKCRNGALGGALGGLLGGLLFDTIASGSDMAARATGFVILGVAIGALVGLTQLVLKEAWLTVVDGLLRPGRELILGQNVTMLGRGDHLPLPFLGYPGRDLEAEHARITRQSDGQYVLEDNRSRLGTRLNGQPLETATPLKDGDLIKLGSNLVRFNARQWGRQRAAAMPAGAMASPPLPPPPKPLVSSGITSPAPPMPASGSTPPAPPMMPPAPPAAPLPPPHPAPSAAPSSPYRSAPSASPMLPGGAVPPPPRRLQAAPRIPPPPPPPSPPPSPPAGTRF